MARISSWWKCSFSGSQLSILFKTLIILYVRHILKTEQWGHSLTICTVGYPHPHPSKTPIIPNTLKPKLFCIFNQYEWNRWWSILNVMFKSQIHADSWTTLQSCKWSTLPIPLTTIVVNTTGHHCGLNYQIQLVNAKRTPKPSLISNLRWGYFPEQSQSLCCADSEACFNIDSNLTLLCMVLAFAIGHWWTNHWCKLRKPLIRFPSLSAKRQSIHHIEMPI